MAECKIPKTAELNVLTLPGYPGFAAESDHV